MHEDYINLKMIEIECYNSENAGVRFKDASSVPHKLIAVCYTEIRREIIF